MRKRGLAEERKMFLSNALRARITKTGRPLHQNGDTRLPRILWWKWCKLPIAANSTLHASHLGHTREHHDPAQRKRPASLNIQGASDYQNRQGKAGRASSSANKLCFEGWFTLEQLAKRWMQTDRTA